jgi:hypothetical protein
MSRKRRHGPKVPKAVKALLKTGVFRKSNSDFGHYRLRLVGTDFILTIPRDADEGGKLYWMRAKLGATARDFEFYPGRPAHSILSENHAQKASSLDVFDEAPPEIIEKLAFHIDILPRD